MDAELKRRGRQISALRAASSEAAEHLAEIRHTLEQCEPDAVWRAEEAERLLRNALKRADRMAANPA